MFVLNFKEFQKVGQGSKVSGEKTRQVILSTATITNNVMTAAVIARPIFQEHPVDFFSCGHLFSYAKNKKPVSKILKQEEPLARKLPEEDAGLGRDSHPP
jgi:hypothetical protein